MSEPVSISRTISALDGELFEAIGARDSAAEGFWPAGDRDPALPVPREIVFGLMSAASSQWCAHNDRRDALSYGYDEITFGAPVRAGDTLVVTYDLELPADPGVKLFGYAVVTNQRGEQVARARHTLWHRPEEG